MTDLSHRDAYIDGLNLNGQGFIILGAGGGGMGTQISVALAAAGAELVCVDFRAEEAEEIARATGGVAHVADVTSRADMEGVVARAVTLFGLRFRGVVDIVGMAMMGPIPSFDDAAIERQFAIVFRHALLATQIATPVLVANGGGTMVFVGSISGVTGVPNQAIYGAAKAALHHLVVQAAFEFGPANVRFNAIAPGFVRTPRLHSMIPEATWKSIAEGIPLRRVAEPSDIARAALFLASDLSRYVTSNVLTLDGGATGYVPTPIIKP
jgi:NAD(P)-dependent dehydrogenase (short-subunit alcohol dehydrogenase family)